MAYDFTAANSRYLTTSIAPVTASPLTIACWFYPKDITTAYSIATLNSTTGALDNRFALIAAGNVTGDPLRYFVRNGATSGGTTIDSTSGYTANTWHHVCGISASTTSHTVYLNAGSSRTLTNSEAPSNIAGLAIGGRYAGSWGSYANALIAEVGVWNVALTQSEVASLSKGMSCNKIRPDNLVFYAPLVRDLIDEFGGLTITNNNSTPVANHPRIYY